MKIISKKTAILITVFLLTTTGCGSNSKGSSDNTQGLSYYNKGQYHSAVTSFEAAIATNKKNPDYYVNLGMTYIELEDYEEALTQFNLALKLNSEHRLAKRGIGITRLALGEYEEAITCFQDVLLQANGTVGTLELDLLDYRGIAETKLGRYDAAIETYTTLIEVNYNIKEHYYQRGHCYLLKGDYEPAIKDFEVALNDSDFDCSIYLNIYHALDSADYNEEAINFLGKALTSPSAQKSDDFSLGLIYYYLADYTNAILKFNEASSDNHEALLYLSKIYLSQHETIKAKNSLSEYLTYDNSNGEVYNQLGLISVSEGDYTTALTHFQNGILTKGTTVMKDLKWNEAVCYEYLGDFSTARTKIEEFLKAYPDDAKALAEYEFLETR
ncbi:MAG: tetratricopeptide repeat protein [Lachnospiraceae bacterium]|nr:tetratricopeptide repeat protein [Lachnospiraceae bacterium]